MGKTGRAQPKEMPSRQWGAVEAVEQDGTKTARRKRQKFHQDTPHPRRSRDLCDKFRRIADIRPETPFRYRNKHYQIYRRYCSVKTSSLVAACYARQILMTAEDDRLAENSPVSVFCAFDLTTLFSPHSTICDRRAMCTIQCRRRFRKCARLMSSSV
jgi:hypothetical protein